MTEPPEALVDAALAAFGLLDGGVSLARDGENSTYRVASAEGAFALRIHRPGYQTAASVHSELAWMDALRADGLETPAARMGRDGTRVQLVTAAGDSRLAACLDWIDGMPLAQVDRVGLWHDLGGLMATVHAHGRTWTPPPGFTRQRWDAEGIVGSERPLWGDPVALGAWAPDELDLLQRAPAAVRRRLDALPTGPDRFGLVHADLAFDNVLVRPDGRPVLIDFDDAGWSWYLWELGVALFPHDGEPGFDERRDALVAGYRAVAPLPEEVLAELPTFVMARRIATLGWLFTHAETAHAVAQREWRLRTLAPAATRYLAWAEEEGGPAR